MNKLSIQDQKVPTKILNNLPDGTVFIFVDPEKAGMGFYMKVSGVTLNLETGNIYCPPSNKEVIPLKKNAILTMEVNCE